MLEQKNILPSAEQLREDIQITELGVFYHGYNQVRNIIKKDDDKRAAEKKERLEYYEELRKNKAIIKVAFGVFSGDRYLGRDGDVELCMPVKFEDMTGERSRGKYKLGREMPCRVESVDKENGVVVLNNRKAMRHGAENVRRAIDERLAQNAELLGDPNAVLAEARANAKKIYEEGGGSGVRSTRIKATIMERLEQEEYDKIREKRGCKKIILPAFVCGHNMRGTQIYLKICGNVMAKCNVEHWTHQSGRLVANRIAPIGMETYVEVVKKTTDAGDRKVYIVRRKSLLQNPWERIKNELHVGDMLAIRCTYKDDAKKIWYGVNEAYNGMSFFGGLPNYTQRIGEKHISVRVGGMYQCAITHLSPDIYRARVVPYGEIVASLAEEKSNE